jgi:hypothetical protein
MNEETAKFLEYIMPALSVGCIILLAASILLTKLQRFRQKAKTKTAAVSNARGNASMHPAYAGGASASIHPGASMHSRRAYAAEDLEFGASIQPGVQTIKVSQVATHDNILIVGPKGSGKTTLLLTLMQPRLRRGDQCIAFDPHSKPGKWGDAEVVGGGRAYAQIAHAFVKMHAAMDRRFKALARGENDEGEFQIRTLVGDEFRSIHEEVKKLKPNIPLPGDLLLSRISEGRKVGETAMIVCHNDTVAALGIEGNSDMKSCFDVIVYMGGLIETRAAFHKCPVAIRQEALRRERAAAVVWMPDRNQWFVLVWDVPPFSPPKMSSVLSDQPGGIEGGISEVVSAEGMVSGMIPADTSLQTDTTDLDTTPDTSDGIDEEVIKALRSIGWTKNKIAERMKGKKQDKLARIDAAMIQAESPDAELVEADD